MCEIIDKISLDRLTLVGFKVGHKLDNYLYSPLNIYVKNRYRASNYPYSWTYELVDGILQVGDSRDQTNVRLDFNPSNLKYPDELKKIISCIKYVKTSRVDVAIDIKNIDLNNYAVLDGMGRKYNQWYSGLGKLETHYIGAPRSDLRIRIYDKAKEQGEEGKLWRFESQLRGNSLGQLKDLDPYKSIEIIKKNIDLDHISNFKERVFIDYLLKNSNDLHQLSRPTMYRYKKILSDLAQIDSKNQFDISRIYKKNINKIVDEIYDFVKPSKVNNVIPSITF